MSEKRKDYHMIEIGKPIILFCDDWSGDYQVEGIIQMRGHKRKFVCLKTNEINQEDWRQRNSWKYKDEGAL